MPNKSLWDINISGQSHIIRLRFVHVVWLAVVLTAGLAGWLGGADNAVILTSLVVAAMPGIVGAAMLTPNGQESGVAAYLVIGWTVFAVVSLALTGGVSSPMTIAFAIAPLVALGLGQPRMAAEAAVFSVLAYASVGIIDAAGGFAIDVTGLKSLTASLALGALMLTVLLVWMFLQSIEGMLGLRRGDGGHGDMATETETRATLIAGAKLPENAGLLLMDVASQGRLRSFSGDTMGLDLLKPGAVFADLFKADGDCARMYETAEPWMCKDELKSGRAVEVYGEPYPKGTRIVLRDDSEGGAVSDETATQLDDAKTKLQARTAFFASLGHDLKTPLNAILGYADMMRSGIRGPMPEPYADYPEIIYESGQDLLLLVEDILDLAKAEADSYRLEMEPVDLSASGESVMRQLQNQAERNGVKLKLKSKSDEVWAEADARAVRQIWQNLVSNAIKYSSRDSVVTLETRMESNAAVLSVTDKGAGMSEDDLARVTEPFQQGVNAKGRVGTGLGLAVVKRFAELHGGMLDIETALGKGTKVEVSLPVADVDDIDLVLGEAAE